jgi:hypothetical protein
MDTRTCTESGVEEMRREGMRRYPIEIMESGQLPLGWNALAPINWRFDHITGILKILDTNGTPIFQVGINVQDSTYNLTVEEDTLVVSRVTIQKNGARRITLLKPA